MKTINGMIYSKTPFEGWKFRAKFRFKVDEDWRNDTTIDIYTNCSNRLDVHFAITSITTDKVIECNLENFTTKEQDEWSSKLLEEFIKDI